MVNKPKAKGTSAESAVVSFLRTKGFPYAERLALQGGKDRGDITGIPGICIEVKATAVYTFSSWLREAMAEKENSRADFAFVAAKPRGVGGTRVGKWMAVMTMTEFARLVGAAGSPTTWVHQLHGNNFGRDIGPALSNLAGLKAMAEAEFGVVTILPRGVDNTNLCYAVTMLEDMSGLLVRAGYGRLTDVEPE